MREEERQLGIDELTTRLAKCGLEIIEQDRPWSNRYSTYFELGKPGRQTSIVLSDEFMCDLPATREYQAAVDSYAAALVGRIRCGSPNVFYCLSSLTIKIEITWPIQAAVLDGMPSGWFLVDVINEANGTLAKCCLKVDRPFAYSGRTTFDDVRNAANRIRQAIDEKSVSFYEPRSHPDKYQRISDDSRRSTPAKRQSEIERFVVGKTYALGFLIPDVPGETWIGDPWDAEYLGVTNKALLQSAYVLRAQGLINLDVGLSFARPSDKLLTLGWPGALDSISASTAPQVFELSSLPKKAALLTDLTDLLTKNSQVAVIVIDLDKFKEVNDTKGHREGDMCLEKVVKVIGTALGRKGTLYRWGGDEFAASLPDFSTDEASITAERIRRAIEQARVGEDIPVTASVGVCANDRLQNPEAEALLDSADKAMYASKRNGKNQVSSWPTRSDQS